MFHRKCYIVYLPLSIKIVSLTILSCLPCYWSGGSRNCAIVQRERKLRSAGAYPGVGIEHFLRLEADQATCSCHKEYNSSYPLTGNLAFFYLGCFDVFSLLLFGIESVAQPVAKQVERQYSDHDE